MTASGSTRISIRPESTEMKANAHDLCYLNIELVGEDGVVKSSEDCAVTVEVSGAGQLLALGSAKPNMGEDFISSTHTTYYGKALAIIRAGEETGTVQVKVRAEGMPAQSITLCVSIWPDAKRYLKSRVMKNI